MENVPGMVYWKEGAFGDEILKRFTDIGYTVKKEILLAADWGVPQRRRRLFIVGVLDGQEFQFPEPTHMGGWRRDSLELWETRRKERGLLPHITLQDAIGDPRNRGYRRISVEWIHRSQRPSIAIRTAYARQESQGPRP